MTFTSNIPAVGQSLGSSRPQVVNNFTNYFNALSQDHVQPNGSGGIAQGKHNKSTYPEQTVDPVTIANEIALYSKQAGSVAQLFMRRESSGTVIQMSNGDPIIAANGETFIPGGFVLKWFTTTGTGSPITFTSLGLTDFPNNAFAAVSSPKTGGVSATIVAITTTSITLSNTIGNVYVFVIGN